MNPTPTISADRGYLERVCKNAGSWMFWIAGITAVIVVVNMCGASALGYLGLLVPTLSAADHTQGTLGPIIGAATGVPLVAIFCTLGYFASSRGALWAFIAAIVLYAIDAVLFAFVKEWIGVALHAYALFGIFRGVGAARQLSAVRASERSAAAQAQPIGAWYATPSPGAIVPQPALAEPNPLPPSDPM